MSLPKTFDAQAASVYDWIKGLEREGYNVSLPELFGDRATDVKAHYHWRGGLLLRQLMIGDCSPRQPLPLISGVIPSWSCAGRVRLTPMEVEGIEIVDGCCRKRSNKPNS